MLVGIWPKSSWWGSWGRLYGLVKGVGRLGLLMGCIDWVGVLVEWLCQGVCSIGVLVESWSGVFVDSWSGVLIGQVCGWLPGS